ncbi:MAG: phosphatidylserine/phosphatidylglycerophosphate/cardiolipin synthase family protein [Bacteroidetes bacterium]|nr:phosphatidylserine/phosphatidylglycerophosphate/cardiolipin synthase family protein [Bacteroidota bacterium]
MIKIKEPYHLISEPLRYYDAMIADIESAKKYIYVETFRIGNDAIGERFLRAFNKKAKQGLDVKLLVDGWGVSNPGHQLYGQIRKNGGVVRFFEKIKYNSDIFTKGHRRNHRKLLLIDDEISWIGSSNLTGYNMNWRESMLRMKSEITYSLSRLFMQDFRLYNKYVFNKVHNSRLVRFENFEIVRDVPSIAYKRINKKFIRIFQSAKKKIIIETPYFIPGFMLRKAMADAAKRGVEVMVIIPKHSDVTLVDILRNKYLGPLSKNGIQFLYYKTSNLHAKLMLVDDEQFAIGSSNFDYRSFRYMFEIMIFGDDPRISEQFKSHIGKTLEQSEPFVYGSWKKRPLINKFFEWLLLPFRHLL